MKGPQTFLIKEFEKKKTGWQHHKTESIILVKTKMCKIRYSCAKYVILVQKNVILAQTADVKTALCARISVGRDIVILVQILLLRPCILLFLRKSAKFSLDSHNLSKKLLLFLHLRIKYVGVP